MTMAEKAGFKTVETDLEELNEKRKKNNEPLLQNCRNAAAGSIILFIIIMIRFRFLSWYMTQQILLKQ